MPVMMKRLGLITVAAALAFGVLGATQTHAQKVVEINFLYPTAVGGPITKVIDGLADKFNKANSDVHVTATYGGGYTDVYKTIDTDIQGGSQPPDVAVMLSTDAFSLADNDYIVPLDDLVKNLKDGDKYEADFFPGFMLNSRAYGKLYGIPFQRSTPVLYYNRDMFKAAGLPDRAPETQQEMADWAQKLTKPDQGIWGLKIPSDGFPYWVFQSFAIANGKNLVGDAANKVFFNTPEAVDGLQYISDLSGKYNAMPKGVIVWNDTPTDFTSGKVAMIYHTTGSLTNILKNAKFQVGVGFLPKGKVGYGAPTGGGNLYILKNIPDENKAAAWRFIQFLSDPQQEADWTVATGYIAPRQSAWNTDTLKQLSSDKPQYAVARDQLQYAQKELATHRSNDIQQIFAKAVQAVINGDKQPKQALDDAQTAADAILSQYPDEPVKPVAAPATMAPTMAATAAK
jgi:sn-glycerol 3-phosphate transport system substrate-binding protein